MKKLRLLLIPIMALGCASLPEGIEPVGNFDINRYLGKWYEIARLDHSFERGLSNVSAEYSLREDGGVRVLNRGYFDREKRWKQAEGKACFVRKKNEGYLKVSFFGPFYGTYLVFELDPEYKHAFVTGPNRSYLWFLARTPSVKQKTLDRFIARSKELGFDTEKLIFVEQEKGN